MELLDISNCMQADEIYKALGQVSERARNELDRLGLHPGMTQEELIDLMDQASEKTFTELVNMDIFGPVITMDQIQQLCSGMDEAGQPNAFAALSIDAVTEDMEAVPYANISFGNPVLNLYAAGGCVVVTADFQRDNMFEYRRARDILSEWISKKGESEFDDKLLSFSVFPVATNGQLSLIYHELVFAQGIPQEDGTSRIIMAFDGNQTQEILDMDVHLDELKATVDAEIAKQAEAMQEPEREARAEGIEDYNVTAQFIEDSFTPSFLKDSPDDEVDIDYENIYTSQAQETEEDEEDGNGTESDEPWVRFTK